MSNLPYEIREQILLRLPARSIIRLSLVCKQWRSLISDPNFVKDHANLSDQSSHNHRLITNDSMKQVMISRSIDEQSDNSTQLEFSSVIKGSCHGLLLLARYHSHPPNALVLWNPLFTQNYKLLPQPNFTSSNLTLFEGFGYATSIDDYKVVRLCVMYPLHCYSELEVEVYSLKTNSWKIIPARVPAANIVFNTLTARNGTNVRGSIYWIIHDSKNAAIIAFNLSTEKFKILETPSLDDDDNVHRKFVTNILQVGGCLGAYRSGLYIAEDTVIWIWNEDENKKGGYWTKLLTIPSRYPMFTQVLSFLNNNQVLLHVSESGGIGKSVIYDSACMMFQDTPCENVGCPVHVVETLVSPVSF